MTLTKNLQNSGIDKLETLIITSLDFNKINPLEIMQRESKKKNRRYYKSKRVYLSQAPIIEGCSVNAFLNLDDMPTTSPFTMDLSSERLYTDNPELLIFNPIETIGDQAEVIVFSELDSTIKWVGFRKIKKPPKNFSYLGKASAFYEYHFKKTYLIDGNLPMRYDKFITAVDKNGRTLPTKYGDFKNLNQDFENYGDQLILTASTIEDAYRSKSFLCTIKEGNEIKFPVSVDEYMDFFKLRSLPISKTGRRKAIIHWVAEHMRRNKKNGETKKHIVKSHLRGVQQIEVDGLSVFLTPNDETKWWDKQLNYTTKQNRIKP